MEVFSSNDQRVVPSNTKQPLKRKATKTGTSQDSRSPSPKRHAIDASLSGNSSGVKLGLGWSNPKNGSYYSCL
jgi:hypothetical protein